MLWRRRHVGLSTDEWKRRVRRAFLRPSPASPQVVATTGWDPSHQAADRAIRIARWFLWVPLVVQGGLAHVGGWPALQALFGFGRGSPSTEAVGLSAAWALAFLCGLCIAGIGANGVGMALEFGVRSVVRMAWLGIAGTAVSAGCAAAAAFLPRVPGWNSPIRATSFQVQLCLVFAGVMAVGGGVVLSVLLRHARALAEIDAAIQAHSPLPERTRPAS